MLYMFKYYSYLRTYFVIHFAAKLSTKNIFPIVFTSNSPVWYFGGVSLMRHNHLLFISSSVQILCCMYVYILYLFRKILRYSFRPSI